MFERKGWNQLKEETRRTYAKRWNVEETIAEQLYEAGQSSPSHKEPIPEEIIAPYRYTEEAIPEEIAPEQPGIQLKAIRESSDESFISTRLEEEYLFEDTETMIYEIATQLELAVDFFQESYDKGFRSFQIVLIIPGESKGKAYRYYTIPDTFPIRTVFYEQGRNQIAETIVEYLLDEGAEGIAGFNFLKPRER